jgi:hypothetical protein
MKAMEGLNQVTQIVQQLQQAQQQLQAKVQQLESLGMKSQAELEILKKELGAPQPMQGQADPGAQVGQPGLPQGGGLLQ